MPATPCHSKSKANAAIPWSIVKHIIKLKLGSGIEFLVFIDI
jgi:hypothetical protein